MTSLGNLIKSLNPYLLDEFRALHVQIRSIQVLLFVYSGTSSNSEGIELK
jgi:hypothetical protein